jgi:hypothetical protein
MPDVSVELVSNMMEGIVFFCPTSPVCNYILLHMLLFLPISQFLDPFICRGQKTFCCSHSRSCIGWWPRVDYGMAFLLDVARADC